MFGGQEWLLLMLALVVVAVFAAIIGGGIYLVVRLANRDRRDDTG